MNEVLQKSNQTTSPDSPSATSLLESLAGATPLNSLDGQKIDPSGQEAVPVNPSQTLAKDLEKKTPATSGQNSFDSSPSESLQLSLENRLRQRLAGYGSQEYELTWKHWPMQSGPQICALRASKHRMLDQGSGGLPTPQAMDAKGYSQALSHKFRKTGHLKHWVHGTPLAVHSKTGRSSWPNPMLVEWMMGFPRQWISGQDYEHLVTQSCRNSRQNSSNHTKKPQESK